MDVTLLIKPSHRLADSVLLLLYIAVCAVILFRVNIESTGYLTPDSEGYLQLAQNLKDGKGFYLYNPSTTEETFFSVWPVGYPVLIYLVSIVTSFNVFWASKVLNLLLLGSGFLLLRQLNRTYSFVLASVYCSYTLLEVYSFTWSEAPFLLGMLYLCYLVNKMVRGDVTGKSILLLFLACLFLFLMRYIGAFSFSVPVLLACFFYYKRRPKIAGRFLLVFFLLIAAAGLYLLMNYSLTGYATGGERLEGETETVSAFLRMVTEGVLNELLLVRKFRIGNQPDYLLYFTVLLQLMVMGFIAVKLKRHYYLLEEFKKNAFSLICLFMALLYLAAIVFLRSFSHFDDLDYRLLSPFSFLFWVGIINILVSLPDSIKSNVQVKNVAFGFFCISLLLNLPKQYLLEKVMQLLS